MIVHSAQDGITHCLGDPCKPLPKRLKDPRCAQMSGYYGKYEGMPWRDTPKNRDRWAVMMNSYDFLHHMKDEYGELECHYCGLAPLCIIHWNDQQNQNHPRKATVDHVVPRSRGGSDDWDNLVVSCMPCNYAKGDKY